MQKSFLLTPIYLAALCGTVSAQAPATDEIAALRKQVEALSSKVGDLEQQLNKARLTQPVFTSPSADAAGGKAVAAPVAPTPEYVPPKETNLSLFNPEISAALDFIASYSRRADNVNFIMRDAEIMLQANVDHLVHAYAVFNAETELAPTEKTDPFDEIKLGIEEAAIETTDLPWGLKVKAGQFFADFTRLGKVHSHELPFTDRPPSIDRIIGGEDKARGLEVTWIPPVSHYVRLTAGVVDSLGAGPSITTQVRTLDGGEDFAYRRGDHRGWGDVMYYGRAATIFELGSQAQINLGGNYARGRDAGSRQIASGDFKFTWTPRPDGYDLFELGGEYLWSKSHGALSDGALILGGPSDGGARAQGGYVYAQYRIGKQWQPGIRFDYLHADQWEQLDLNGDGDPDAIRLGGNSLKTYSAYLTYYLSEFNRLHLQVNYARSDRPDFAGGRDDWQAFFQWSITLGPHKHPFSP